MQYQCDPASRCYCSYDPRDFSWSWPMHWRPDLAPVPPWGWLDARANT